MSVAIAKKIMHKEDVKNVFLSGIYREIQWELVNMRNTRRSDHCDKAADIRINGEIIRNNYPFYSDEIAENRYEQVVREYIDVIYWTLI